jgi:hypothetical protein
MRASKRLTRATVPGPPWLLSPDPELRDEGAIALDVGVPQVVQQTPLLADQEKEAAAGVVVFGVRFQVLGELPDASGRQRDLYFGGTSVPFTAPVIRDQLALDFFLYCQTRLASIRGDGRRLFFSDRPDYPRFPRLVRPDSRDYPAISRIRPNRPISDRPPRATPRDHR